MDKASRTGLPVIGLIFLALAVFKFLSGDDWVVWAILGVLFGGLGVFARKSSGEGQP